MLSSRLSQPIPAVWSTGVSAAVASAGRGLATMAIGRATPQTIPVPRTTKVRRATFDKQTPQRSLATAAKATPESFKSLYELVPDNKGKLHQVAVHATVMPNAHFGAMDGNEAAAHVAYAMSELSFIYPITPSTPMAELMDVWANQGRKNFLDQKVDVSLMQSEGGASAAVHGALVTGTLCSTFTCSQGLMLMLPVMYRIAGELNPSVFHVSARALTSQGLSIFGDHSDVMAARQTGFALLSAHTVQETMDLALVSHLATLASSVPFIHFFDGFRTSHEIAKIDVLPYELIKEFAQSPDIQAGIQRHRDRALHPYHPVVKGSVQGPDVFFQSQEAANQYQTAVPAIVQTMMDRFAKKSGRQYHLFDYAGHPQATHVVVVMGAGSSVTEEVAALLSDTEDVKIGVLKVRLFRPWSVEHFLSALPATVKKICVLERYKEDSAAGEPLFRDVCAALQHANNKCIEKGVAPVAQSIHVVGGRFGLGSKEFTPAMALAVWRNLLADIPRTNFTVGINDDVSHLSLPLGEAALSTVPKGTVECMFWGLGGDGTVGANKDAITIIGDNTDLLVQGYFFYDAHKTGGVTVSHLRFGPHPITAAYLIQAADYIACHVPNYLDKGLDVLGPLKREGVFVLNTSEKAEDVEKWLPARIKRKLAQQRAQFYIIDAFAVANAVGLGRRINNIMQACFFALSQVLPLDKALALLKDAIKTTYGNKGEKIVNANISAVDKALASLKKMKVPEEWQFASDAQEAKPSAALPEFAEKVLKPLFKLEADTVPVSALPVGGWSPVSTSQFEKRGIARATPQWFPERCTQCNYCSFVCPHAAIRPFVLPAAQEQQAQAAGKLPAGYVSLPLENAPAGLAAQAPKFSVQVSGSDCTGCGLCIQYCPGDALEAKKATAGWMAEQDARFAWARAECPEVGAFFDKYSVRGSQFQPPLLEFSGACEGCGETPYVKLITQLFGTRLVLANATGCSMVWSSTFGVVPYTTDKAGRGPAWGNSLFENNAEYGLGIHKAALAKRRLLAARVQKALAAPQPAMSEQLKAQLTKWLAIYEKGKADEVNAVGDVCASLLAQEAAAAGPESPLRELAALKDGFPKLSTWIFGGDGWAYDIGYGGLDHVLASGENVKVLVLDNEMYSNTGGQKSKATPLGAVVKFAAGGNLRQKKDLGMLAMQYGDIYVASVALGANMAQLVRALAEAESYPGTALVVAYVPCIMHSNATFATAEREKIAVDSGYWTLYRYDPRLKAQGKSPFQLDSKKIKTDLQQFLQNDLRFRQTLKKMPAVAADLKQFTQRRMAMLKLKEEYEGTLVTGKSAAPSWNIADDKAVLVLYGSETGNSELLATRIAAEAKVRGVASRALPMDDFDYEQLNEVKNRVVFVCSTCGQGKFPANAEAFWGFLSSKERPEGFLSQLQFSVFGLGDSKYSFFNKAAADLDKRLVALGGKRVARRGVANDRDDDRFETAFEDWEPELWQALDLRPVDTGSAAPPAQFAVTVAAAGTRAGTVPDRLVPPGARSVPVAVNRRLTPSEYNRDIRHVELDLSAHPDFKFNVGDALGVWAHNPPAAVDAMLAHVGLAPDAVLTIQPLEGAAPKPGLPAACTAKQLFGELLDICGRPSRRFLGELALFAADAGERQQLRALRGDKTAFKQQVADAGLTFLDLLQQYPSAKPSVAHLLQLLPVIKPRFYSIASAQKAIADRLHLCVVVNSWQSSKGQTKFGLCSSYLARVKPADEDAPAAALPRINVAVSPAAIEMPDSPASPLVLCGLGTGIAPFRGWLQERAALLKQGVQLGPCVFYYGCRHEKQEFLYADELREYLRLGVLSELRTAFSHDQEKMIFVQHRMEEDAEKLHKILVKNNGYFYFCGPAGPIPEAIKKTISVAISKAGNMTPAAADKHLQDMTMDGRYNVEAWG